LGQGATSRDFPPTVLRNDDQIQRVVQASRLPNLCRVVIGMLDQNPSIQAKGVRLLRDHNIATDLFPETLAAEVENLNRHFRRQIELQVWEPRRSSEWPRPSFAVGRHEANSLPSAQPSRRRDKPVPNYDTVFMKCSAAEFMQ